MSRIGPTLSGIERRLLNQLAEASAQATLSSLRMATGKMINSPRDDPSAFVRLSGFQTRLSGVRSAMTNVTAASSMITQTQTTLSSIRTQLDTIRTELLKDETGSLTGAQRAEAQAAIDTAINQINTLAGTQIDGRRLLDGSANFIVSGRNASQVDEIRVYSTGGATVTVTGSVTQAAAQASLTYNGGGGATVQGDATFTLTGDLGSVEVTVNNNEALSDVADRVNADSHKTGVTAAVSGNDLIFSSVAYGSNADATIDVSSGTFIVAAGQTTTDAGTDAQATINGQAYTGNGNLITISRNSTHYTLELDPTHSGALDTITISGDALTFALSTDLSRSSTLSIPSVQAARLGGPSGALSDLAAGGTLADLGTNTSQAIRVVDEALADLTLIEGSVDGFYDAAISSFYDGSTSPATGLLADLETDLLAAIDEIDLVDDTEEAVRRNFYLDLASNSVAGLAILQQQRASIVNMLQVIAGLR